MKHIKLMLSAIMLIAFFNSATAQLMTNDNVAITIQTGIQLTVQGDIQNQNTTTINNSGTISLSGNWINNANNACFGNSQGTVILDGINQSIGGSNSTTFNNLNLQGGGTKTIMTDISVGGNYISPSGVFNVGNSIFDLNSKTISISNSSVNAITAGSGYILSEDVDNSSKLTWAINNSSGAHSIPFGNASGELIPLTFNLTSGNAGDVTFSTYVTTANNLPLPVLPTLVTHVRNIMGADNSANVVDRFWQIDPTGNPTASLTFTYASSENAANGNVNMVAQRWVNPTAGWASPAVGQTNPTSQSVLINNVSAFGPWAITSSMSPLPIELLQFTAKAKDNTKVVCDWVTASEINNDFFTVERSKDGFLFESAGVVNGNGTTSSISNYSFVDTKPYPGKSYYRIKQTDYNGIATYSPMRTVLLTTVYDFNVEVFPNPVVDFIQVVAEGAEKINITITDVTGKIVKQLNGISAIEKVDFTNYSSGVYFLTAQDVINNKLVQVKLIKN